MASLNIYLNDAHISDKTIHLSMRQGSVLEAVDSLTADMIENGSDVPVDVMADSREVVFFIFISCYRNTYGSFDSKTS